MPSTYGVGRKLAFSLEGKAPVMIRIFTADERNSITITIDGQLVGATVDVVKTCAHEALAQGRTVHLFLRNVSHIDHLGRTLLTQLTANGVELSASGVYSSYIVEEVLRGQKRDAS